MILCQYNVDTLNICMKEFIIFVCTDSTEIFFSKLRSSCLIYNLPSFFTDSYCAGVSNKHCLLTFFIVTQYRAVCMLAVLICIWGGGPSFSLKTLLQSKLFNILADSVPERNFRKSQQMTTRMGKITQHVKRNKDNHRFR